MLTQQEGWWAQYEPVLHVDHNKEEDAEGSAAEDDGRGINARRSGKTCSKGINDTARLLEHNLMEEVSVKTYCRSATERNT
jgi:hypothetical protein